MHHEATVRHFQLNPAEHSDPNGLTHVTNTTQDVMKYTSTAKSLGLF